MAHIRFDGRVYPVTEQELKKAERKVYSANVSGTVEFIKVVEVVNGQHCESALVYTRGVPLSFHYWNAT